MSFIRTNKRAKIGEWYFTKRILSNSSGYFEVNTLVKVINIGERGYDLEDKEGNRITETGFDSIEII